MTATYVARQPILNRKKNTLGYELLFRDGERNAYPAHIESNRATYRLIVENFLSVGLNPSIPSSRCFINFPYQSLIRRLPLSLPKDKVVVEILETCQPTDELLEAVKELYQAGYMIALDDFTSTPEWERFLKYTHIVKLDIMQMGLDEACDLVKAHQGKQFSFLAERVETEQEFQQAKDAGFKFFQGYFFSKPEIIKTKYISPEQVIAMELFQEVCKPDVDFQRVENIVAKDVALSYKLLRFVNTMSPRLEVTISSFRQALVYLGQEKLKMFVSLAVASYVSDKKPKELYGLSLQRAQFCQRMSRYQAFEGHTEQAFMIGLFSLLDALLDLSLENLVEQLPLCKSIKVALLRREGPYGTLLALEESFEHADWQQIDEHCADLGLSVDQVKTELTEARRWSHTVTNKL
ncbi:EAL and HDOD domain-containing protein [Vibrio crassostreae]|uniref:Signal transduction protein containing EAL and modified HD-GYP domains n=1 Tax=Vibrio crassostreae TaxID=246167 RepID=A0ABM9QRT7_9VIBR|nr:EAL and HDOD domain-containing protein [Vibrio crassostreae]ROO49017.1 EAL and modified HD-GYP domain-containing signal transduction protein [Vibrio crassostreae]ROO49338.1 EAL and modified HD-GYP domain-containing signal transduction protein [Vibrio crassostreae]ROO78263.1 EAL and modified HD-GYP domain-containing signal transduction protein [Vibrio crassostreae]ROO78335.1 EAL and modified HD-GYP domain-containing signal transduction protein [Vibrio crassostreae]ROR58090.1 EAL and modified